CEHQVVIHDGKLVLRVTIRSNDLPLGNPFNVAQYGLLAHLYAKCTGFPASELIVQITDAHVYSDQWDGIDLQLSREASGQLPTLSIKERGQKYLTDFEYSDFTVNNYFPEHKIQMPITIVGGF
ncbi:MAG: thymidylate synthase, partial [Sphaerospermopsis kisseleviana]